MIRKIYEVKCDYCNGLIFSSINKTPSTKTIREHCKLIIRNGKILTFHHECYIKLEDNIN